MALLIDERRTVLRPHTYRTEAEFEAVVVDLADEIFGSSTIYIDVKRRLRGKEIVTIPDGYLVDMTEPQDPRLFIIENEIVSHDPFRHVGVQLLKFATNFEDVRIQLRRMLMGEIEKNQTAYDRLRRGCDSANSRNIDHYLDQAVFSGFRALVVIDEARPELHRVLEKINADISVLELRTFVSDDGAKVHQFDTLYEEFEEAKPEALTARESSTSSTEEERRRRRERLSRCDTVIVPAREEGFQQAFIEQEKWWAIRVGAAMKQRIKYIAAYRVAPVSAITHMAEVQDIRPYEDSGKYLLTFKRAAEEIAPVPVADPSKSPQGPVYVRKEALLAAENLEEALENS